jgi:hypothetical protein
MGFAMFVATGSFFLGQADELPEAIRIVPLLALPVLATLVFTPYWLVKVLRRRKANVANVRGAAPMSGAAP